MLFSIMAILFYIPTRRIPSSPNPCRPFLSLVYEMIAHSDKCEVVSYFGFDLHFPDDE